MLDRVKRAVWRIGGEETLRALAEVIVAVAALTLSVTIAAAVAAIVLWLVL